MSDDNSVIHKLTLCSHDRNDLNEDTSDFSINIEQIANARKFCLRNAFLPLSSYTFEEGDIDSKLTLVNLGTQPKGVFMHPAVGGTLFLNGFAIPIGSDYDPSQTFPNGDPDSTLTYTFSWMQIPPGTKYMIKSPLFRTETEPKYFYDVPNCDNTSGSTYLNVNMFTVMQGLNEALRYVCRANMGEGHQYECQIGISNYKVNLNIDDYDREREGIIGFDLPFFFCVFMSSNLDNMTFKSFEFGTSTDPNPRPAVTPTPGGPPTPIGPGPWFVPPIGWTVKKVFTNQYNTPTGTKQTVACTQFQGAGLYAFSVSSEILPSGVVYDSTTIIAALNSQTLPDITCSLSPTGGVPALNLQNTGPRFYADLTVSPNLKLGITDFLQTPSAGTFVQAQQSLALVRPGDIQFFSIPVDIPALGQDETQVRDTCNAVLNNYDITMYVGVQYSNSNILNIPGPIPSGVVAGWDVPNKGVYGYTLDSDKNYIQAGCRFDVVSMNPAVGNPASYWTSKNAQFVYYTGTNGYMMQQDYYLKSMPKYPLWNYQFPLDELLTTSDVQTVLTSITVDHPALTLTLDNTKNEILIDNNGLDFYQFYPNHKMGVYDTTTADSSVISVGGTSEYAQHPVDLSGRNACMSIGLSFYHDGRTAQCYGGRAIHGGVSRPIRRNIVATVYNASQTNYGQMIHYSNPSDTWLPCYYHNIQDIRIQIYNDQLLPINLHKKDVHLEIDIMADPV